MILLTKKKKTLKCITDYLLYTWKSTSIHENWLTKYAMVFIIVTWSAVSTMRHYREPRHVEDIDFTSSRDTWRRNILRKCTRFFFSKLWFLSENENVLNHRRYIHSVRTLVGTYIHIYNIYLDHYINY